MTTVRDARRPIMPARTAPPERRPFRDNPRLILLGIVLLFGALAAMVFLADKSTQLNPDSSRGGLYALSAADSRWSWRSCSCWRAMCEAVRRATARSPVLAVSREVVLAARLTIVPPARAGCGGSSSQRDHAVVQPADR